MALPMAPGMVGFPGIGPSARGRQDADAVAVYLAAVRASKEAPEGRGGLRISLFSPWAALPSDQSGGDLRSAASLPSASAIGQREGAFLPPSRAGGGASSDGVEDFFGLLGLFGAIAMYSANPAAAQSEADRLSTALESKAAMLNEFLLSYRQGFAFALEALWQRDIAFLHGGAMERPGLLKRMLQAVFGGGGARGATFSEGELAELLVGERSFLELLSREGVKEKLEAGLPAVEVTGELADAVMSSAHFDSIYFFLARSQARDAKVEGRGGLDSQVRRAVLEMIRIKVHRRHLAMDLNLLAGARSPRAFMQVTSQMAALILPKGRLLEEALKSFGWQVQAVRNLMDEAARMDPLEMAALRALDGFPDPRFATAREAVEYLLPPTSVGAHYGSAIHIENLAGTTPHWARWIEEAAERLSRDPDLMAGMPLGRARRIGDGYATDVFHMVEAAQREYWSSVSGGNRFGDDDAQIRRMMEGADRWLTQTMGAAYLIAHEVRFHPGQDFMFPWFEVEDDRVILHTTPWSQDVTEDSGDDPEGVFSLPHLLAGQ